MCQCCAEKGSLFEKYSTTMLCTLSLLYYTNSTYLPTHVNLWVFQIAPKKNYFFIWIRFIYYVHDDCDVKRFSWMRPRTFFRKRWCYCVYQLQSERAIQNNDAKFLCRTMIFYRNNFLPVFTGSESLTSIRDVKTFMSRLFLFVKGNIITRCIQSIDSLFIYRMFLIVTGL